MNTILKNTLYAAGGLAVGVLAGILTAPRSGKETRDELKNKVLELQASIENLSGEARAEVERKIVDLKKTLKEVEGALSN